MKEAKIVLPNVESTVKHLRKVSRAIGESKNAAAVHRVNSALVEFARRRDTNNDYEKERKGGFSVNSV
ncbi:hypothetical protein PC111_g14097 [Phytophthora cactorum]|nr:hypothetical protein PC111_g14097 [Phytophthora cactorum]